MLAYGSGKPGWLTVAMDRRFSPIIFLRNTRSSPTVAHKYNASLILLICRTVFFFSAEHFKFFSAENLSSMLNCFIQ